MFIMHLDVNLSVEYWKQSWQGCLKYFAETLFLVAATKNTSVVFFIKEE